MAQCSARPSVREVPSSIAGDITSLCQLLSVLCSLNYNPEQNYLGQYCNIHIFLSFLGSLLKQCILPAGLVEKITTFSKR